MVPGGIKGVDPLSLRDRVIDDEFDADSEPVLSEDAAEQCSSTEVVDLLVAPCCRLAECCSKPRVC